MDFGFWFLIAEKNQRVVVLKDQVNKKAHEESAQLACEAAGAIRTVASLTREDDCLRLYSQNLEGPLRRSSRSALWSNALYAFTQAQSFWVIALIFWWGATLVSRFEASIFDFFIGLMVFDFSSTSDLKLTVYRARPLVQFKQETFSLSCPTCLQLKAPVRISSNSSTTM